MSVLIKGMEMPESCDDCILLRHYRFLGEPILCCEPNDRELIEVEEYEKDKKRLSDCPLVEVPVPHGRLIDADELANKTFYSKTNAPYITYHRFVNAPTVIGAEREASE